VPHFADRLTEAIRAKGSPLCVGLDPVFDRLPRRLRETSRHVDPLAAGAAAIGRFSRRVCEVSPPS
jgi:orotidine-5'-phosphate decarboxylase